MKKYKVWGIAKVNVYQIVEAENKEDAIEAANQGFQGLSGYCGNGGSDKLVGTYDSNCGLDVDYVEAEFDTPEEITEEEGR